MKVSIIIPVHNAARYLPACLTAVLGQSLKDIEVICIDDGSFDSSGAILSEFSQKDPRLSFIRQNHSGPGAARNLGIGYAIGEYLGFVDSDDIPHEDMVSQLYYTAKENGSDMAVCYPSCFDDLTKAPTDPSYFQQAKKMLYDGGKVTTTYDQNEIPYLLPWVPAAPWNKIVKTSLVRKSQARFSETIKHEDLPFYVMVMLHAQRITILRKELYRYRINCPTSLTGNPGLTAYRDIIKIFEEVHKTTPQYLIKKKPVRNALNMLHILHVNIWLNRIYRDKKINQSQKKELFGKIHTQVKKLPPVKVPGWIDHLQYLMVRYNVPALFRWKVKLDRLKESLYKIYTIQSRKACPQPTKKLNK